MDWNNIFQTVWPIVVGFLLGGTIGAAAIEVVKQLKELLADIELAAQDKQFTKEEIAEIAKEAKDVQVSVSSLWGAIKRLFGKK